MSEAAKSGAWKGIVAAARSLESLLMLAAGAGVAAILAGAYEQSVAADAVYPGVKLFGEPVGGLGSQELADAASVAGERSLDRPLTLRAGDAQVETTARALGAVPTPEAAIELALSMGRSGDLLSNLKERAVARQGGVDIQVGLRFEEEAALSQLLAMAPEVDRPSLPTRLDLDKRAILPAQTGTALLPYDSLSAVALGLAGGADEVDLVVQDKPGVEDPLGEIAKDLDVGVVLGSFSTPYSMDPDKADRTHNLKVGAAAVDGTVLMPGEEFSFNRIVGERSAEAGYRYAPGITSGELVDVLGGGICQVASSLHGAVFFSGLEISRSRPHSRPSSYVDMGLDATVVYDAIDLRFRNDLDFPVVIHMTVNQGKVQAEILGPQRPHQVAFERKIDEVLPYRTIYRDDPSMMLGTTKVAQRGMRGFSVKRLRKLYAAGEVVKNESWDLHYPPTTEIIRRGTNPAGVVPEHKTRPALRDPAKELRIVQ